VKKLLIAGLLIPLGILLSLEGILRLRDAGRPVSLFIARDIGGKREMAVNFRAGWRFFPGTIARRPLAEHFSPEKSSDTVRIFILGESAARGESLADFSFGRMLRVMLQAGYPDKRIEVINTGIPAINSWVLREFAFEIGRYSPDIVIFYGGHNEILGPYGPASAFTLPSSRAFTTFRIWLSGLKLAQLSEIITGTRFAPPSQIASGGWRGLEMFLEKKLGADDAGVLAARHNFKENITDMIQYARDAGAEFIACVTPANLSDSGPFASLAATGSDTWKDLIEQAVSATAESGPADALLSRIDAALASDSGNAGLAYAKGKRLLKSGRNAEARASLARARDLDALRFRITSDLQSALASAATGFPGDRGVLLLDLEKSFSDASPAGICGREFFYDHVHLTLEGHWKAANDLFNAVTGGFSAKFTASPAVRLSREETLTRLGYSARDELHDLEAIRTALSRPPLTERAGSAEQLQEVAGRIASLREHLSRDALVFALASVSLALHAPGADPTLSAKAAALAADAGLPVESLGYYDAAVAANPIDIDLYNNRGLIRLATGDSNGATADFRMAIEMAPNFAGARFNLGAAYAKTGKPAEALAEYVSALAIDPGLTKARLNMANLLLQQGKLPEAISQYKIGLTLEPGIPELRYGLGNALMKSGLPNEALAQFDQIIAEHPSDGLARFSAARALLAAGRPVAASVHLKEAARLCPDQPAILQLAATVLATSDNPGAADPVAAVEFARKAVDLTGRTQPELLQLLGVACAAAGRFEDARTALEDALRLAQSTGKTALATEIQENLRQLRN